MIVKRTRPKKLLSPTGGFLEGYSHTLNPYGGCAFACSYCYVRRMPVALFRGEAWGTWVDVKSEAARLVREELKRAKRKGPVTIFMSSATDPYQPAEYRERVTRSLLEAFVEAPPDFLFVQTRSPLVTRDLDLLQALGNRVRVSVTVETDREDVRRAFTPFAPPVKARLRALRMLAEAGIPNQAAVSPVLPNTAAFADTLLETGTNRVCIDDYFMGDGSHGSRTARLGLGPIYESLGLSDWYAPDAYLHVREALVSRFGEDRVLVSREGFMPDG